MIDYNYYRKPPRMALKLTQIGSLKRFAVFRARHKLCFDACMNELGNVYTEVLGFPVTKTIIYG